MFSGPGRPPVEHVDQLQIERQPVASHDHVLVVQVAVVLAEIVDLLDARGQGVQQVQSPETIGSPLARLPRDELAKQLAFHVFRDQEADGLIARRRSSLGCGTGSGSGSGGACGACGRRTARCGCAGLRCGYQNFAARSIPVEHSRSKIDFALPAGADLRDDFVLVGQDLARLEAELFDPAMVALATHGASRRSNKERTPTAAGDCNQRRNGKEGLGIRH